MSQDLNFCNSGKYELVCAVDRAFDNLLLLLVMFYGGLIWQLTLFFILNAAETFLYPHQFALPSNISL